MSKKRTNYSLAFKTKLVLELLQNESTLAFGKTKNLFDKFQTGCVWKVCVAIL
jgi:hypothetical protein